MQQCGFRGLAQGPLLVVKGRDKQPLTITGVFFKLETRNDKKFNFYDSQNCTIQFVSNTIHENVFAMFSVVLFFSIRTVE